MTGGLCPPIVCGIGLRVKGISLHSYSNLSAHFVEQFAKQDIYWTNADVKSGHSSSPFDCLVRDISATYLSSSTRRMLNLLCRQCVC